MEIGVKEILAAFDEPTPENEKKYRVGNVYDKKNGKATILTYIDARFVQDKLDEVVGKENWSNYFETINGNLFCTIVIRLIGDTGEVIEFRKTDVGIPSNVEKEKGEASDAFKRAAVHLGIGRDLYNSEAIFADLEYKGEYNGEKKWALPFGWRPKQAQTGKVINFKAYDPTPKQISHFQELARRLQEYSEEACEKADDWFDAGEYNKAMWDDKIKQIEKYLEEKDANR